MSINPSTHSMLRFSRPSHITVSKPLNGSGTDHKPKVGEATPVTPSSDHSDDEFTCVILKKAPSNHLPIVDKRSPSPLIPLATIPQPPRDPSPSISVSEQKGLTPPLSDLLEAPTPRETTPFIDYSYRLNMSCHPLDLIRILCGVVTMGIGLTLTNRSFPRLPPLFKYLASILGACFFDYMIIRPLMNVESNRTAVPDID